MRRLAVAFTVVFAVVLVAVAAQADPSEYQIESASAGTSSAQAGDHPDFEISVALKRDPEGRLPSTSRDFAFELPPGLLANPTALPTCSLAQLVSTDVNDPSNETGCPQASQVGLVSVTLFHEGAPGTAPIFEPLYNLEPGSGEPARLGFIADVIPVLVHVHLRPEEGYAATATVESASSFLAVGSTATTVWGTPADKSHDAQRITPYEAIHHNGTPETPTGKRPAALAPVPFMLNPTRCGVSQGVGVTAVPYAMPSLEAKAFAPLIPNSGCGLLRFRPQISIEPTSDEAETGSGLDVAVDFPTEGLERPGLFADASQKRVELSLPEGITVNPSQAAAGLAACSEAELARETSTSVPGAGCPEASKIGTISARSPLLDEEAEGSVFLARPYENPFGTLIAVYLVLKVPQRGIVVKLPVRVELDPRTGRLTTTVDDIPQLPVQSFRVHLLPGARSALVTPAACGTYESTAAFTSWARPGEAAVLHPRFEVARGPNGGHCPQGVPPFHPKLGAGGLSDVAAAFTPYYLRLSREDGEQEPTRLSVTLPPGSVAKLAGVLQCPNAAIEAASARTGRQELSAPSCPAGSEIGRVLVGAGTGSVLTYVAGKLYLAGPYRGDPLSVVAIVPAVAGPFDLGVVATREGLALQPGSARARIGGSRSDPIPHILAGIPLRVRDVRAFVDRPRFMLNPTNCNPLAFGAELWGAGLDPYSPFDDSTTSLAAPFQVADCARLGFKPKLSLQLHGPLHRGGHPALHAVFRPRKGDANARGAQVTLPHYAFVDQGHIDEVCTRVQFAAGACPPGSAYGRVKAFSPLLDQPLRGPVYLRSSNHELPDLVLALHGIVDLDVAGRIDSVKGRLRTSFEAVPDAPVSRVVIDMQGGKKGLIVNSENLCAGADRASARFRAQNGKRHDFAPAVQTGCARGGAAREKGGGPGTHHR